MANDRSQKQDVMIAFGKLGEMLRSGIPFLQRSDMKQHSSSKVFEKAGKGERMRPAVRFAMFAALVVSVSIALADSPAAPFPYVETTFDGTHYFKMLPGEPHPFDENARGEFYRVGEQKDELLWRTEGWFAFQVFLAGNGDHMVRMGPWSSGGEPATNDLAIAFYMKGQLVKSYSTKDLMPDPSKVRRSVSHYKWIKSITGLPGPVCGFATVTR